MTGVAQSRVQHGRSPPVHARPVRSPVCPHLRQGAIASAWVVTKPTVNGPVTSLELYDDGGKNIALFHGQRKPGQPENPIWRALVTALPETAMP